MKSLLVISLLYLFFRSFLGAAEPLPLSKFYWKDADFLKSFNASYRINARIEPSVTTAERGLLVSIQPLMASGRRKEALRKLISNPLIKSSAAVVFNAGNIYFELGDLKQAEASYQRAIKVFPNFRRAHRNLGFVYARQDNWGEALPELKEAIRLGDQDAATYGQLGYGHMHNGQYASALQAYRLAQVTQPRNIDWKAGTAQCLQHLQRNEEALALLDEVIEVRPTEPSYYLLQVSIYLSLNRLTDAITNLDLVRRLGKLDAENHLLLANLHLRSGSTRLARPVMMEALNMKKKPSLATALNVLTSVTQTRNWTLARDFSRALSKTFPEINDKKLKHQQRRLNALIDIDSGQNPARGAAVLEELIKSDPFDASSLLLLANYRRSEKRLEEAVMLLQQAGRVNGFAYQSYIELAKVYVDMTDYTKAIKVLDKALKIKSTDSIATYRKAILHLREASQEK